MWFYLSGELQSNESHRSNSSLAQTLPTALQATDIDVASLLKECSGKLKVKVLHGRKLVNKETLQTSDPYCMIEIAGKQQKTKHLTNSLNPDWNEVFVFDVPSGYNTLALSIWDKNMLKKDVFMGHGFVSIDDCKKNQETLKVSIFIH